LNSAITQARVWEIVNLQHEKLVISRLGDFAIEVHPTHTKR
jgi:hypothetical protein